ncbi:hypothetical protein LNAT_P0309 [Lebetimonas natsushimae]|uniref:Uncharacterized protein n=1 Tax=Lebetimonas natsushimae TaxID=1936991 RepID=A0A292YCL5_9BACT|nr:hypothetical protein [Lebetimonas natsushimae]GAX87014.1 hypothetical protein LNAT_P0309 [Lebetimonas natsushimae]
MSEDLAGGNITLTEDEKFTLELENEKDKKHYRKLIFYILGGMVILMFLVSFTATYWYIYNLHDLIIHNAKQTTYTGIVILLSLTLMIPTVLSLAILRFLFGNNDQKDEKNVPSIIFNIGKELKETLIAIMDKKN